MKRHPQLAVAMLVAVLATTGACGVRKPPRAPEETMPAAPPRWLARAGDDGSVTVHWTRPRSAVDGQPLYDLEGFEVDRRVGDGEWQIIATVTVDDSRRIRPQKTFSHRDADVPDQAFVYRVRAFTADGQRGLSTPPFSVTAAENN